MKIKLLKACIVLICLCAAVSAGLFSVYRSEGEIMTKEAQQKIEAFVNQFKGEQISE